MADEESNLEDWDKKIKDDSYVYECSSCRKKDKWINLNLFRIYFGDEGGTVLRLCDNDECYKKAKDQFSRLNLPGVREEFENLKENKYNLISLNEAFERKIERITDPSWGFKGDYFKITYKDGKPDPICTMYCEKNSHKSYYRIFWTEQFYNDERLNEKIFEVYNGIISEDEREDWIEI